MFPEKPAALSSLPPLYDDTLRAIHARVAHARSHAEDNLAPVTGCPACAAALRAETLARARYDLACHEAFG